MFNVLIMGKPNSFVLIIDSNSNCNVVVLEEKKL